MRTPFPKNDAGTPRPGRLRADERGMLLVIVMVMLLVVSTIAGANLVNSMLERSLARNQNYASLALQAAEAGVADGITWLNLNQATIPDYTTTPTWTQTIGPRDLSLDLNGDGDATDPGERLGIYTVTLRFKREWRDYNGDADCVDPGESSGYQDVDGSPAADCPGDVVLFNRAARTLDGGFGFSGSLYDTANSGYPVVEVDSVGRFGNAGYRQILFDIARNKLDAQVEGAFTARSGVTASGASNVDGRNRLASGALDLSGSCGGDKPGVTVDDGVALACDLNGDGDCGDAGEVCGNATGNPCWDTYDPTEHAGTPLQKTPWGVLGISQTDFEGMFTKRTDDNFDMACSSDPYFMWYAGTGGGRLNNSSACTNYSGILVIHNENFDPDFWEASCPAGEASPGCAGKAPAVFDMDGNVGWTGIVIADQVVKVSGNPIIRGGIISLASGGIIESDITGNIDIEYSCEAVTGATNQGYKTRLGWHRIR